MASKVITALRQVYGGSAVLPSPFHIVELAETRKPYQAQLEAVSSHARKKADELRRYPTRLFRALDLPVGFKAEDKDRARVTGMLGQLMLGQLAEERFVEIYKEVLGTSDLILEDSTSARNDTDYRVLNGSRRPVFRINIKFHGTLFREARSLVGLEPEDCFALATYKIKQGLDKQNEETLPYVFVVVSCPIKSSDIGALLPPDLIEVACLVHASKKVAGKRAIEEQIVRHMIATDPAFATKVAEVRAQIAASPWRIFSARRANVLLTEKLFDRVYAVRRRGFTRNYPNAEVDMHLSLSQDMTPLEDFLAMLKEVGLPQIMGRLERGTI